MNWPSKINRIIWKKTIMSQSIDFRINDFIIEYLDYKGFNDTVENIFKRTQNSSRTHNNTTNNKW